MNKPAAYLERSATLLAEMKKAVEGHDSTPKYRNLIKRLGATSKRQSARLSNSNTSRASVSVKR